MIVEIKHVNKAIGKLNSGKSRVKIKNSIPYTLYVKGINKQLIFEIKKEHKLVLETTDVCKALIEFDRLANIEVEYKSCGELIHRID